MVSGVEVRAAPPPSFESGVEWNKKKEIWDQIRPIAVVGVIYKAKEFGEEEKIFLLFLCKQLNLFKKDISYLYYLLFFE